MTLSMNLGTSAAALLAGLLCASVGSQVVSDILAHPTLPVTLLCIGLYAATLGIDIGLLRKHALLVASAVTVGVVGKAIAIGSFMLAVTGRPEYLLIGVAVAQIDPLSIAVILERGEGTVSPTASTIIRAWSSLDDPVTALLTIAGLSFMAPDAAIRGPLQFFFQDLGLSLLLAAGGYFAMVTAGRLARHPDIWHRTAVLAVLGAAVHTRHPLTAALLGLVVRPDWGKLLPWALTGAYLMAWFLAGSGIKHGIQVIDGFLLGSAAYGSQVACGAFLGRSFRLPKRDIWMLALAQQNGITALILALALDGVVPGAVATIVPAILTSNSWYFIANRVARRAMAWPG